MSRKTKSKPRIALGQLAFYFIDNKVHSAPISSIVVVENSHDDWAHTAEQKKSWQPFGPSGVKYATCHGIIDEGKVFMSKEELLASL